MWVGQVFLYYHVRFFVDWTNMQNIRSIFFSQLRIKFFSSILSDGMLHTECLVCAMSKTLQTSHRLSGGSYRPRQIIEKVKSKFYI